MHSIKESEKFKKKLKEKLIHQMPRDLRILLMLTTLMEGPLESQINRRDLFKRLIFAGVSGSAANSLGYGLRKINAPIINLSKKIIKPLIKVVVKDMELDEKYINDFEEIIVNDESFIKHLFSHTINNSCFGSFIAFKVFHDPDRCENLIHELDKNFNKYMDIAKNIIEIKP